MAIPIYSTYQEHFKVLQLFGFILLVFGTLVFNEILILPFLGFDHYTKEALEKKKNKNSETKGLLDDPGFDKTAANYTGTSPHAGYDTTRNQRALIKAKGEKGGSQYGDDVEIESREHEYK